MNGAPLVPTDELVVVVDREDEFLVDDDPVPTIVLRRSGVEMSGAERLARVAGRYFLEVDDA